MHTLHDTPRLTSPLAAIATYSPVTLLARLGSAVAIARQRRALRDLDDAILRDIGLTRDEALREATRAFWDAPRHWRG